MHNYFSTFKLFLVFLITYSIFFFIILFLEEFWNENDDYDFTFDLLSEYECGFDPFDDATRQPFDVHYYIVGIIFLIFDVEIACIFPWVLNINGYGVFGFISMFIFLVVLTVGFIYEWYIGALKWPWQKSHLNDNNGLFFFENFNFFFFFFFFNENLFSSKTNASWFDLIFSFADNLPQISFVDSSFRYTLILFFDTFLIEIFFMIIIIINVCLLLSIRFILRKQYLSKPNTLSAKRVEKFINPNVSPKKQNFYFKHLNQLLINRIFLITCNFYLYFFYACVVILFFELLTSVFYKDWSIINFFSFYSSFFYFSSTTNSTLNNSTNLFFLLILCLFAIITFQIVLNNTISTSKLRIFEFYFFIINLFFFFICGVKSFNFIMLFLNFVGLSISNYLIILTGTKNNTSRESCVKYYYLSAMSSAFLATGIFIIYSRFGSADYLVIDYMGYYLSEVSNKFSISIILSIFFIILSFLFKLGAFPGHWWSPDIYAGFNYLFIIISAVSLKFSIFIMLLNVLNHAFAAFSFIWHPFLIVSVIGSIFYGSILTINELKLKKFIAFSSISQVGFGLSGLIYFSQFGVLSSLFYFCIYIIANLTFLILCSLSIFENQKQAPVFFNFSLGNLLFKNTTFFLNQGRLNINTGIYSSGNSFINNYLGCENSRELIYLTDLSKYTNSVLYSKYFLFSLLSLAGLPPLVGFIGKFYLLISVFSTDRLFVVFILLVFSLASAYYYLRLVTILLSEQKIYFSFKNRFFSSFTTVSLYSNKFLQYSINVFVMFLINFIVFECLFFENSINSICIEYFLNNVYNFIF